MVIFLLGGGHASNKGFIVFQLLQINFKDEKATLQAFLDKLKKFDTIVTYNGRSFDIPMLLSRVRLHKLPEQILYKPQIDLYPLCRRLYRRANSSKGDYSLQRMEERLLGLTRHNDIAGQDIPAAYFAYISRGVIHGMSLVIEHHRQDIVSLCQILPKIIQQTQGYQDGAFTANMMILAVNQRDWPWLNQLLTAWPYDKMRQEIRRYNDVDIYHWEISMAIWFSRNKQWSQAAIIWQKHIKTKPQFLRRLAIFYEHHAKNYSQAYEFNAKYLAYLQKQSPKSELIQRRIQTQMKTQQRIAGKALNQHSGKVKEK